MKVILIRFLIGGAAVSAFAVLGGIFKPESFAGSVQPSQVGSMNSPKHLQSPVQMS